MSAKRAVGAAEQARRDRAQRQRRRVEEEATVRISRWYRRRVARVRCRQQRLAAFDAGFARFYADGPARNALKLKPMVAPLPSAPETLLLVQMYVQARALAPRRTACGGSDVDSARLCDVMRLVGASTGRAQEADNVGSLVCGAAEAARSRWFAVMERFVDCVVRFAGILSQLPAAEFPQSRVPYMSCVKVLLDLTDHRNWGFLRAPGSPRAAAELSCAAAEAQQTAQVLLGRASCATLFCTATRYLHWHSAAARGDAGDDVLTVATLQLCTRAASSVPHAAPLFAHTLLFSPVLLKAPVAAITHQTAVWSIIARAAAGDPPALQAPLPKLDGAWPESVQVTGVMSLGRRGAAAAAAAASGSKDGCGWLSEATARWADALVVLLRRAPSRAELRRQVSSSEALEEELRALQSPSTVALLLRDILAQQRPDLRRTSRGSFREGLRPAEEPQPPQPPGRADVGCQAAGLPEWSAPVWLPCCRLLNFLTQGWESRGAIASLSAHPTLVAALWAEVERNAEVARAFADGEGQLPSAAVSGLSEIMLLFLTCYDCFLSVCDDSDFYELQRPLKVSQARAVVELVVRLAFRLSWTAESSPTPQLRLLAACRSVLQKLHRRHARRAFAEPEVWQIPDLKKRYGFHFGDVLRYLNGGDGGNAFDVLFGALGDLSRDMRQSQDPVERHLGGIFADFRNIFDDLHDLLGQHRRQQHLQQQPTAVSRDSELFRCQRALHPMPFIEPFEDRIEYLRCLVERDRVSHHADDVKFVITVSRKTLLEDAFRHFSKVTEARFLKALLHVNFLNHEGLMEAGIDGGGLFKEFLHHVLVHGFKPETGLFVAVEDNKLHPNPRSKTEFRPPPDTDHLSMFRFIGRILAKAVYEGVVVDFPLADFFLNTMLGQGNTVDDLRYLDSEVYKNLTALKDIEDLQSLCLNFTIQDEPGAAPVPLMPGGDQTDVTTANLQQYIALVADYRLSKQTKKQAEAFTAGFYEILPQRMLALFNRSELSQLICGRTGGFSLMDLRPHTRYEGFRDGEDVVEWFWKALGSMDDENVGLFLKFVTSSRRPPLLGFGHLRPPFVIRRAGDPGDSERLPTASTCFNLLKLPPYRSEELLREKMTYAITSEAGFELS